MPILNSTHLEFHLYNSSIRTKKNENPSEVLELIGVVLCLDNPASNKRMEVESDAMLILPFS